MNQQGGSNTMHSDIFWTAVYNDGTNFPQYEEDGTENKYPDIDRSRLVAFDIRKTETNRLIFRLHLSPGRNLICRLICRRRFIQKFCFGELTDPHMPFKKKSMIYLVGWQANIGGRNVQDIAYIFEDGHVELAGPWKEDNALFSKIGDLLPCERDSGINES